MTISTGELIATLERLDKEALANARLIAAAPALLAALQGFIDMAENFPGLTSDMHDELAAGYAAIAKATGEPWPS